MGIHRVKSGDSFVGIPYTWADLGHDIADLRLRGGSVSKSSPARPLFGLTTPNNRNTKITVARRSEQNKQTDRLSFFFFSLETSIAFLSVWL